MTPIVVQENNTIVLPSQLVQQLGLPPGSRVYVYQIGETLSVRCKSSELLEACEEFETILQEEGVTLDSLLESLEEEREASAQERRERKTPSAAV
jgi:antitoxin component of MazEF toxin-antitoxin module